MEEIRLYQKIRNPLTHEAFLRREHFTHDVLVALMKLYQIFQRYRAVQNNMIKRERKLFLGDGTHNFAFFDFVQHDSYTREQVYQRLGGGLAEGLTAPFRNAKPAYVVMPRVESNGLDVKIKTVCCGDIFQETGYFRLLYPISSMEVNREVINSKGSEKSAFEKRPKIR
jgi:hypothetical protein